MRDATEAADRWAAEQALAVGILGAGRSYAYAAQLAGDNRRSVSSQLMEGCRAAVAARPSVPPAVRARRAALRWRVRLGRVDDGVRATGRRRRRPESGDESERRQRAQAESCCGRYAGA